MSKPSDPRIDTSRVIHAPHGTQLHCKTGRSKLPIGCCRTTLIPTLPKIHSIWWCMVVLVVRHVTGVF